MTEHVSQMVDLATPEGIYTATGETLKYSIGELVLYRGRECKITGFGVEVGRVIYMNDLGHWGYENNYSQTVAQLDPVK